SQAARSPPFAPALRKPHAWLVAVLGAIVLLALGWLGLRLLRNSAVPAAAPPAVETPTGSSSQSPDIAPGPTAPEARPPNSAVSTTRVGRNEATSPAALHEVIPEASPGARRTIHGQIKVWVRVTLGRDGTVSGAALDRTGPSR